MIAQIRVGSQNSPRIVIDRKNLSINCEQFILIFCKNNKQSICGLIQEGLDKQSIILYPHLPDFDISYHERFKSTHIHIYSINFVYNLQNILSLHFFCFHFFD